MSNTFVSTRNTLSQMNACTFPNIDAVVDFLGAGSGFFSGDAGLVVAGWGCLAKVVEAVVDVLDGC